MQIKTATKSEITEPTMPNSTTPSKHGKVWTSFEKLGVPVNKFINSVGSEAFWPTSLDHESTKAGRILKSFCKDGFYKEQQPIPTSSRGPTSKPKVLVKIPAQVIQNAIGLAIFSVGRIGTWGTSFSGGSGVLLSRTEEGTWSPPSGIVISTLGFGFMGGIDVYDCVLVINDRETLKSFQKMRFSLGAEAGLTVGPVGVGGVYDTELVRNPKPVFTYVKSRGLYAGVQLDGTVIAVRRDENERFYGVDVGGVERAIPGEARELIEVVNAAEGWVEERLPGYGEFEDERGFYDEKRQFHEGGEREVEVVREEQRDVNEATETGYPPEKKGTEDIKQGEWPVEDKKQVRIEVPEKKTGE